MPGSVNLFVLKARDSHTKRQKVMAGDKQWQDCHWSLAPCNPNARLLTSHPHRYGFLRQEGCQIPPQLISKVHCLHIFKSFMSNQWGASSQALRCVSSAQGCRCRLPRWHKQTISVVFTDIALRIACQTWELHLSLSQDHFRTRCN